MKCYIRPRHAYLSHLPMCLHIGDEFKVITTGTFFTIKNIKLESTNDLKYVCKQNPKYIHEHKSLHIEFEFGKPGLYWCIESFYCWSELILNKSKHIQNNHIKTRFSILK